MGVSFCHITAYMSRAFVLVCWLTSSDILHPQWEKLQMTASERRKIMCSVTFHIIAITCVVWSLYVLIDRTADEIKRGRHTLGDARTRTSHRTDVARDHSLRMWRKTSPIPLLNCMCHQTIHVSVNLHVWCSDFLLRV